MITGYLPYLKSAERGSERTAKFIANYQHPSEGEHTHLGDMDVSEIHQVILNYLQHEQEHSSFSESSRFIDSLYSFNVQPTNSFSKYLCKAGVAPDAVSSLKSDWDKVGSDLWLSILRMNHKKLSY